MVVLGFGWWPWRWREVVQSYCTLRVGLTDGFAIGVQEKVVLINDQVSPKSWVEMPVTDMGILQQGQI